MPEQLPFTLPARPQVPILSSNAQRQADLQARGSGISNIHNPFGRILARVGDAILASYFPTAEMLIPGTEGNYNLQLARANRAVRGEEAGAMNEAEVRLKNAQAGEQENLPAYHQALVDKDLEHEARLREAGVSEAEIKRLHEANLTAIAQGKHDVAEQQYHATLAKNGFKEDENGKIVPLGYDEMSEEQQGLFDLRAAQKELADANAQYKDAQTKNLPQQMALAQARINGANQARQIAERRLNLSEATYNMRAFGTDAGGQPLPGAILTEGGTPVGTANAPNVRPTGTQRTRAGLAQSGREQLDDMLTIVKNHPEYFGPGAGRATAFTKWIGSQDPEAQRFLSAREILADHAAGVFGARSEAAVMSQKIAAGELKDNPAAIAAGLGQIDKAMKTIEQQGAPRTVGSSAANEPRVIHTQAEFDALPKGAKYIDSDGKHYTKK